MNRSEWISRISHARPYILFVFFVIEWCIGTFPAARSSDWCGYYTPGEKCTNWFSPLFWHKMQLLHYCLGMYNAELFSQICAACWFSILFVAVFCTLRTLIQTGQGGSLFMLILICLVNPLFLQLGSTRLDVAFAAWLLLTLCLAFCFRAKGKTGIRYVLLVCACAFNTCSYRQTAFFVLPIVIYYALPILPGMSVCKLKTKLFVTFCVSLVMLVALHATNSVLSNEKTNGAVVMMQSDIRSIVLMSGDTREYEQLCAKRNLDLSYYDSELKLPANEILAVSGIIPRKDRTSYRGTNWGRRWAQYSTQGSYRDWERLWCKTVMLHPVEFLTARAVMWSHFYLCGYCPPLLSEWLSKRYTGVCASSFVPRTWEDSVRVRRMGGLLLKFNFSFTNANKIASSYFTPVYRLLLGCFYVGLLVTLLAFRQWRKANPYIKFSIITTLAAGVYLLSFIPFVPTPDHRYSSPSLLCFFVACAVALQTWYNARMKKA